MKSIGIIGFGGIVRNWHIKQIQNSGKFSIKAAADIFEDDKVVRNFHIPDYYTDYREMLKDPEIEAVLVASPHDCHEEHCIAALEAGKHIIVEKPISRNLEEARNIMTAAEKSGTVGMIGFCQRFDHAHQYIKEVLENEELGELLSARIDHYQNFNPGPNSWWRNAEKVGGGAVIGSGVHRLDLLHWFFGEAVSVYAQDVKMPERLEAEACVHAVIKFENGVIANFSINWAAYHYLYCEGLSISGKNGLIFNAHGEMKKGLAQIDNGRLKNVELVKKYPSMYEHFADCIESNRKPLTNLEEGYKSLQLVRAIYKSMETGSPVNPACVDF